MFSELIFWLLQARIMDFMYYIEHSNDAIKIKFGK